MSMTFEIPQDVQAGLDGISDLNLRVAMYFRHEAQLEVVRQMNAVAADMVFMIFIDFHPFGTAIAIQFMIADEPKRRIQPHPFLAA
ncbi:MAG: hypothetical protein ABJF10_28775 [Chthoniobacter sp.]|uniref:hypothetical protein n=1 Tax=Chthoniobacter sp. TaxID=2510640 RepID=UPI0032A31C46